MKIVKENALKYFYTKLTSIFSSKQELNELIWLGTQQEYDAIQDKKNNTLYCIIEK